MNKQLEVGKTYTAADGSKWRCIAVNGYIAHMHEVGLKNHIAHPWQLDGKPVSLPDEYRIVFEPERGEMVLTGGEGENGDWDFDDYNGSPVKSHRLTIPTLDGEIATGIYTGPDGHRIKVEKL